MAAVSACPLLSTQGIKEKWRSILGLLLASTIRHIWQTFERYIYINKERLSSNEKKQLLDKRERWINSSEEKCGYVVVI